MRIVCEVAWLRRWTVGVAPVLYYVPDCEAMLQTPLHIATIPFFQKKKHRIQHPMSVVCAPISSRPILRSSLPKSK